MAEPVSDILLERYLTGDLSPAQKIRIEVALAEPSVAARLSALRDEREQFYAARSTDAMVRGISLRAAEASFRLSPRQRWWTWLTPVLATTAGVLLVFKMWSTFEPTTNSVPPASVAPKVEQAPAAEPAMPAPGAVPPTAFAQPPSDAKKGKKSFAGGGAERELALGSDKLDSFGNARSGAGYAQPPPSAAAPAAKPKPAERMRRDEMGAVAPNKAEDKDSTSFDDAAPRTNTPSAPPQAQMAPSAEDAVREPPAHEAKKSRRAPSGHFTFSQTQARAGERLGYSVDSGGYSVVISMSSGAPPRLLADNSQHPAKHGTFTLAAGAPRHERVLLFVMSDPFDASALLATVTTVSPTASVELEIKE